MPIGYQLKAYTDAERVVLSQIARQRGLSIEQVEIELAKEWVSRLADVAVTEPISVLPFPEVGDDR
ncbi:hypothetical protein BN873_310006 [Candidatus Competibacter denitrificans Run_A_D11]|uniref:Uncharacterized protein n=1 Tax=Candidatus Competibacter denitrificans Run_A_D11 TaxID=1400863 RepID=W6M473_9GAMM|nr:hypothetical protein [Candidatus Competibacter denitrificans]CDI02487.1 hypothetical protein BN873_310006 [Candidatus Competibacter denitrificans Run_A_D11]HAS86478.1 hypothetical protein [Candidatus Competibacteraceae bacterium]HRC70480.1 hypothetical protein [Candidatus Competibacter denitrificans]